jgi:hypothetical protein
MVEQFGWCAQTHAASIVLDEVLSFSTTMALIRMRANVSDC